MKTTLKTPLRKIRARSGWRAAAVTFICGAALTAALRPAAEPQPQPATREAAAVSPPQWVAPAPPLVVDELDWGQSAAGQEWKHRNNGHSLRLDYGGLSPQALDEAKVEALPSGGVLVAAGDTVSMFDGAGGFVWRHEERRPIFDFAYVEATGLVYATAGDNNMFILEARTGRELHRESRNGRAGYGAVVPFGEDQCLIADDNSGYRSAEDFIPPMSDGVSAWRGTKMLWHQNLPPDAELRVGGGRIFAVTKTRARILVEEIFPPAGAR
ncbi:MAG TPA: hypothetical protein VG148_12505 [Pyrinomonadaceae bacterium]|nr:hypothetical protein [Pyrinomonadaceae bacterium]